MENQESSTEGFGEINSPQFLLRLRSPGIERQAAFRLLVEVTHNPLLRYIRKFVASADEGQEVLQEVYLGVYKGLAGFEAKSKLTTWIYGLTHHKVCDRLSDRYRLGEEFKDESGPEQPQHPGAAELLKATPWEMGPDKMLFQSALKAMIGRAIASLPPVAAEIYHLRDIENLSGEEVAEVLRISPATVRVRLHRARNLIVEMVKEQLKDPGRSSQAANSSASMIGKDQ